MRYNGVFSIVFSYLNKKTEFFLQYVGQRPDKSDFESQIMLPSLPRDAPQLHVILQVETEEESHILHCNVCMGEP